MGKKNLMEKILYFSFFLLKKKLSGCAVFFFFEALEKVKPVVGLKLYTLKKRKIQRTTAVPYIASLSLQYKKAIFWLMSAIKIRKEKKWSSKLFQEFYDIILNKTGNSFLKKKEFYKYVILFKTTKKFK
jgi:ribosomal protein S7